VGGEGEGGGGGLRFQRDAVRMRPVPVFNRVNHKIAAFWAAPRRFLQREIVDFSGKGFTSGWRETSNDRRLLFLLTLSPLPDSNPGATHVSKGRRRKAPPGDTGPPGRRQFIPGEPTQTCPTVRAVENLRPRPQTQDVIIPPGTVRAGRGTDAGRFYHSAKNACVVQRVGQIRSDDWGCLTNGRNARPSPGQVNLGMLKSRNSPRDQVRRRAVFGRTFEEPCARDETP